MSEATYEQSGRGPGRPQRMMRWTVEHAASEFGIDRRTLATKIRANGILPDENDNRFSTVDICRAIFGNNPRDEREREQAENFRLKNQALRQERVPINDATTVWGGVLQEIAVAVKSLKGKHCGELEINGVFAIIRGAGGAC